jgi:zinc-binding alcohol dehydrogenase/oxidoreductase
LFSRAQLKAGESLLVLGAGGGVATMAVSLASVIGCRVVVTSSSDEKIARSQELGAVAGVRYDSPDWPDQAKMLTPTGRGFDVVLDPVGHWGQAVEVVRPGGRIVVLGASRAEEAVLPIRPFYFGQYSLLGTTMGSRADFEGLLSLYERQDVARPVVDRVFPLDKAAAAHAYLEAGAGFGKVVLEIG